MGEKVLVTALENNLIFWGYCWLMEEASYYFPNPIWSEIWMI